MWFSRNCKNNYSKKIEKELNYKHIDLYDVIKSDFQDKQKASEEYAAQIDDYLSNLTGENYVIDCDYLIFPEEFNNYKSKDKYDIIFWGFNDIDFNILYSKFKNDYIKKIKILMM